MASGGQPGGSAGRGAAHGTKGDGTGTPGTRRDAGGIRDIPSVPVPGARPWAWEAGDAARELRHRWERPVLAAEQERGHSFGAPWDTSSPRLPQQPGTGQWRGGACFQSLGGDRGTKGDEKAVAGG